MSYNIIPNPMFDMFPLCAVGSLCSYHGKVLVDFLLVFGGLAVSGIRKDECVDGVDVAVDTAAQVFSQFVLLVGCYRHRMKPP